MMDGRHRLGDESDDVEDDPVSRIEDLEKLGGRKGGKWQARSVRLNDQGMVWDKRGRKGLTAAELVGVALVDPSLGRSHVFVVRSRAKKNKTYTFGASSAESAEAWVNDLARLITRRDSGKVRPGVTTYARRCSLVSSCYCQ